jgi:hypothetical protein
MLSPESQEEEGQKVIAYHHHGESNDIEPDRVGIKRQTLQNILARSVATNATSLTCESEAREYGVTRDSVGIFQETDVFQPDKVDGNASGVEEEARE